MLVPEPWPTPFLLVPLNSTVIMNCTASDVGDSTPFWAADLSSDSKPIQFRATDSQFNANGLFELPPTGEPPTLRLLINDTSLNNQTGVYCNTGEEMALFTTLFVFGKLFTVIILRTHVVTASNLYGSWTVVLLLQSQLQLHLF